VTSATLADRFVVTMAREVQGAQTWGLGLGTVLPALAVMLAQRTHAPHALLYASGSNSYVRSLDRLWLTRFEYETWRSAIARSSTDQLLLQERTPPMGEFLRPAQIDALGDINVTRLPGPDGDVLLVGGTAIPDMAADEWPRRLYATTHDRAVFVERVHFVSGTVRSDRLVGRAGARARIITDLGVFRIEEEPGLVVEALASGVTLAEVRDRTAFAVRPGASVATVPDPTDTELALIREMDPLGLRELEFLHPRDRDGFLRRVVAAEAVGSGVPG
jgi:glutaconate CoA-transferase subunit B